MATSVEKSGLSRVGALSLILGLSFGFVFSPIDLPARPLEPNKFATEHHRRWFLLGERLKKEGDFRSASQAYREALVSAQWTNNVRAQVECLSRLGVVFWDLGELDESRAFYKKALAAADSGRFSPEAEKCRLALEIDRLYRKGKDYSRANQMDECISSFKRAIKLSQKLSSPNHEAKCLRWMSTAYYDQNDLKEFYKLNSKALQIYKTMKNDRETAYCLFSIGLFYKNQFDLPLAFKNLFECLSISHEQNMLQEEIDCYIGLGEILADIGLYDKAIVFYLCAQKLLQCKSQSYNYPLFLNNLGVLYRRKSGENSREKNLKIALSYFYDALVAAWRSEYVREEAIILNNIGYSMIILGRFAEALKFLDSCYVKSVRLGNADLKALCQVNRGHVFYEQKMIFEAKSAYGSAIVQDDRKTSTQHVWEAYWGLGRCHERQGDETAAEKAYLKSIRLIEEFRHKLNQESDKAGFSRDKIIVYESLLSLLFRHYQSSCDASGAQLVSVIERAKARAFLEILEARAESEETNESAQAKEGISRRISVLMRSLSKPDLPPVERENMRGELIQQEEKYARWTDSVGLTEKHLFRECNFSLKNFQGYLLQNRAAVVEYFLGEERSYLVFLTGSFFKIYPMPSRDSVESSIRLYVKMLSVPSEGEFRGGPAARRLYQELLFPLEKSGLGDAENLVIVPDGLLCYLPFETLISGDEQGRERGRYLLEKYNVSYAPSLSALMKLSLNNAGLNSGKTLLALGDPDYGLYAPRGALGLSDSSQILREMYLDQGFSLGPLPYTSEEIKGISAFLPADEADILLKSRANEELLKKKRLTDYQVIHFACHGFLDERFPQRSALVLSPAGSMAEDGFLQAREISSLRTHAALVVLSACQTGRGTLEKGEGLLGLPRVFMAIGAKSVISALWPVHDQSTSLLMRAFYSGLSRGLSKSRALREAKADMLRSRFRHPFYWAAFILYGDYGSAVRFPGFIRR